MKNIIVLGSINTDLIVRTARFPRQGETVTGSEFTTLFGGKGANQSIAAARLGARVSMFGRIGEDSNGKAALENLRRAGVGIGQISVDPSVPSGMAFVLIDESGNNSIIVTPGANGRISLDDLERSSDLFTPETILVTQLEISNPIVMAGIELAKSGGSYIILNPSPATAIENRILSKVNALILNETELVVLSQSNDMDTGLDTLQHIGIETIVLTLGDKGCLLVEDGKTINLPAHPVQVVDTTGAGDAFIGAYATAIAEELDVLTACRWGNAAGAVAVTSLGAQSSLPSRAQLLEMIKTNNP
jgi:ribokinase